MRKGFNFYRSYWEVANELNDKDRLAFYDALLLRQFTGKESELSGLVKFAYLSQKHSIDRQIKGYEDKTKNPLIDPCQGGNKGGSVDPCQQEKEEEKEKVKGKEIYIPELSEFLAYAVEQVPLINKDDVKHKYNSWVVNEWKDGNDKPIKNWKTKLLNTLPYLRKIEIQQPRIIHD